MSAIRAKIGCKLSALGLTDKCHEILRIEYKGGKRSFMVTLAFAVNFTPKFSPVKLNLIPKKQTKHNSSNADELVGESLKTWKDAVRDLHDRGWENTDIAAILNVSRNQVGSVLAHHCNPNSWGK